MFKHFQFLEKKTYEHNLGLILKLDASTFAMRRSFLSKIFFRDTGTGKLSAGYFP